MKKVKLPIDEIIAIGGELISDSEPKTRAGRWFRLLKKAIQIKNSLNIRIKK